jgi:hypothetical protein
MADSERRPIPLRDVVPDLERPGEPTLEPGLERVDEFEVADRLLTDVGGTIGGKVLSTPGMIAVMERSRRSFRPLSCPTGLYDSLGRTVPRAPTFCGGRGIVSAERENPSRKERAAT